MIKDILTVVLLIARLVEDLPQHKEHMMWIRRIALAKQRMDAQQGAARKRLERLINGEHASKHWRHADLLKGDHIISVALYPMDNVREQIKGKHHPLPDAIGALLRDVVIEVVRHNLMALINQASYGVDSLEGSTIKKVDEVIMKRLVCMLSHERQMSQFFQYSRDFIQSVITWRCLRIYFSRWVASLNGVNQGYDQSTVDGLEDNSSNIATYRYKITDLGSQNPFMNTKTVYVTIEYPSIEDIIRSGKPQWRYMLKWYRDYKRFKITLG